MKKVCKSLFDVGSVNKYQMSTKQGRLWLLCHSVKSLRTVSLCSINAFYVLYFLSFFFHSQPFISPLTGPSRAGNVTNWISNMPGLCQLRKGLDESVWSVLRSQAAFEGTHLPWKYLTKTSFPYAVKNRTQTHNTTHGISSLQPVFDVQCTRLFSCPARASFDPSFCSPRSKVCPEPCLLAPDINI